MVKHLLIGVPAALGVLVDHPTSDDPPTWCGREASSVRGRGDPFFGDKAL